MTLQEQPEPPRKVGAEKPVSILYKRYAYLPPRQRAGRILQVTRTAKRLTLDKLAMVTGIRKDHLMEMEQGFGAIALEEAEKLAHVLRIEPCFLLADVSIP
jgi:hypothetical protein